jgi:hypothetical protein
VIVMPSMMGEAEWEAAVVPEQARLVARSAAYIATGVDPGAAAAWHDGTCCDEQF